MMEKQLIKSIEAQLRVFLSQIISILNNKESYQGKYDIAHIEKYFSLVDSSFKTSFSKISHIYYFLFNEQILIEEMQPFCFLKIEEKTEIEILYFQSVWIMEGVKGFRPECAAILDFQINKNETPEKLL